MITYGEVGERKKAVVILGFLFGGTEKIKGERCPSETGEVRRDKQSFMESGELGL